MTEYESISDLISLVDGPGERPQLCVVNRTEPDAVKRLFDQVFDGQISISERKIPEEVDDRVLLLRDGEVVATSSLESVMNSILLVNSDVFRTGLSGFDGHRLPDVLANLEDVSLTLRGFPVSNKEKLLFVAISREIEARAFDENGGRLDAGFQNLLRIDDEFGTQRVYERLAESNVETHVYGIPGGDWVNEQPDELSVHIADTDEYRRAWFVVHSSEDGRTRSAFLAWEIDTNMWRGGWTYDPDAAGRIHDYIIDEF